MVRPIQYSSAIVRIYTVSKKLHIVVKHSQTGKIVLLIVYVDDILFKIQVQNLRNTKLQDQRSQEFEVPPWDGSSTDLGKELL